MPGFSLQMEQEQENKKKDWVFRGALIGEDKTPTEFRVSLVQYDAPRLRLLVPPA